MLLDNENQKSKVHEWISKYTENGSMSVVTGYFTVGALAWLSEQTQKKIDEYRFILGDIASREETNKPLPINLLNESINLTSAFKLSQLAQEAVEFLKLDKVHAKTLEPNFCHAKLFFYKNIENNPQKNYYISGSSNLTEAGIGLNLTGNVELNIGNFGSDAQYKELSEWFECLWKKPQAHSKKTVKDENGEEKQVDFKLYLIQEISKIFKEYSPKELYYKVLFELFGENLLKEKDDSKFNRQIGRLENTVIYSSLYEFQKKGALSLIKMLEKYNGAILADAVGLGKTWTALAVMKFYQLQGREVILLCPKKLQHNWEMYKKHQDSKFEKDEFEYFIRFHTDFIEDRLEKKTDRADKLFINKKPKLFVIDESHNLRNDKSKSYKMLVDEILAKNEDAKALMLTATPINNSLLDIRNQFKMIVGGKENGFRENLEIGSLTSTFKDAQQKFNDWTGGQNQQIGDFIRLLPDNFFKLVDALTVARTRKMIEGMQDNLIFPAKAIPINRYVTPHKIGNYNSFEELFDKFPPMMSGYQPAFYVDTYDDKNVLENEKLRDRFLVKMMYILLVKRLESSWFSFQSTVEKVLAHHQNALDTIEKYQQTKQNIDFEDNFDFEDDDDLQNQFDDDFELGKKRKIPLADIENAGKLDAYKADLKKDIEALDALSTNLKRFADEIEQEKSEKSVDDKLQDLISQIKAKRTRNENNANQKVVIFTTYTDTAKYLYEQLCKRGFNKIAFVSGSDCKSSDFSGKNFEPILERFAPYTKLFKEKEWNFEGTYDEWKNWLAENGDEKTLNAIKKPIDILISTDVLSEGQNLQDCDMVINYDIHWNPVRVIQRLGRIDRLGSPNEKIYSINYWASENINNYLKLQSRIEDRMVLMKLAGSEVSPDFTESFRKKSENEKLAQRQTEKMLQQMEVTLEDIETGKSFGFDDLSLETFRQELLEELRSREAYYKSMPNGIFTGFKITDSKFCPSEGIIALLKYRYAKENQDPYELVYLDKTGNNVFLNCKETLNALAKHSNNARFVPEKVDTGDDDTLKIYAKALSDWFEPKVKKTNEDNLNNLAIGNRNPQEINTETKTEEKYNKDNFDLITWFIISNNN
ncbi:MAG: DEAD/DEAH box helicase family protein [Prevotellaceae bacterium]|jgi:ERCC4-related helicase|nr:DEAD/DEAH box helicase family protein [Prevotellaceae bacterium]